MADDYLITSRQVRELVGGPDRPASAMWEWRARKRGDLPEPTTIAGRNYYSNREVRRRLGLDGSVEAKRA